MKKLLYIFLIGIVAIGNEYCYNPSKTKINITGKEINLYKEFLEPNQFLSLKAVKESILKNRLFSREFLKKYKLSSKEKMALNLIVEDFLARLYIQRIKEKHPVNEKILKSFYLDHKESFKPLEKVDISTIAVSSLKKADEIFFKLQKDPNAFENIAKKESLDPLAAEGGKYKGVPISAFHPFIRAWINEHKNGDISQPIKIGRLYYIEKIDKKYKVDTSYENLHDDIKKIVEGVYMNQKIRKEFKRLKERVEK